MMIIFSLASIMRFRIDYFVATSKASVIRLELNFIDFNYFSFFTITFDKVVSVYLSSVIQSSVYEEQC